MSSLRLVTLSSEGVGMYQLKTNSINAMETLEKEEGLHNYPGAEIAKFSQGNGELLAVVDFVGIHIINV